MFECAEWCEGFTFLIENIYILYLQFEGMVNQQTVGIRMDTNCAPLIADLFLFCYERDSMFNDSRYLDDIFNIDNPEFEKQIPDIYPSELQFNKTNTSNKETSWLKYTNYWQWCSYKRLRQMRWLRISYRQPSSGWVVMFLDFHRMVLTFLSW